MLLVIVNVRLTHQIVAPPPRRLGGAAPVVSCPRVCVCTAGSKLSTVVMVLDTITKFVAADTAFQKLFREARLMSALARLLGGFANAADHDESAAVFSVAAIARMFSPETPTDVAVASGADAEVLPTALDAYSNLCSCLEAMLDGNATNRHFFLDTYVPSPRPSAGAAGGGHAKHNGPGRAHPLTPCEGVAHTMPWARDFEGRERVLSRGVGGGGTQTGV